jgi:hypothetical protein
MKAAHVVQILVRVRPFGPDESKAGSKAAVTVVSEQQLSLLPHNDASQYVFDSVLEASTAQAQVFEGVQLFWSLLSNLENLTELLSAFQLLFCSEVIGTLPVLPHCLVAASPVSTT